MAVQNLYSQYGTLKGVAQFLGISKTSTWQGLTRYGVQLAPKGGANNPYGLRGKRYQRVRCTR